MVSKSDPPQSKPRQSLIAGRLSTPRPRRVNLTLQQRLTEQNVKLKVLKAASLHPQLFLYPKKGALLKKEREDLQDVWANVANHCDIPVGRCKALFKNIRTQTINKIKKAFDLDQQYFTKARLHDSSQDSIVLDKLREMCAYDCWDNALARYIIYAKPNGLVSKKFGERNNESSQIDNHGPRVDTNGNNDESQQTEGRKQNQSGTFSPSKFGQFRIPHTSHANGQGITFEQQAGVIEQHQQEQRQAESIMGQEQSQVDSSYDFVTIKQEPDSTNNLEEIQRSSRRFTTSTFPSGDYTFGDMDNFRLQTANDILDEREQAGESRYRRHGHHACASIVMSQVKQELPEGNSQEATSSQNPGTREPDNGNPPPSDNPLRHLIPDLPLTLSQAEQHWNSTTQYSQWADLDGDQELINHVKVFDDVRALIREVNRTSSEATLMKFFNHYVQFVSVRLP